jgi:hypothetical protein
MKVSSARCRPARRLFRAAELVDVLMQGDPLPILPDSDGPTTSRLSGQICCRTANAFEILAGLRECRLY